MNREAFRNRIVGYGEEPPEQLLANPHNWRVHPAAQQRALEGVLEEVGWIANVIVNRRTGHVVDGHLRIALAISRGEPMVPVTYVDLSEEEEKLIVASFDPIGALAVTDSEKLGELLAEVEAASEGLQALLDDMAAEAGVALNDIGWESAENAEYAAVRGLDEIAITGTLPDWVRSHDRIYIAFSGGKDSMAAALWVKYVAGRDDAVLIRYDTGIGWPEDGAVAEGFAQQFDFDLQVIGPGDDGVWCEGLRRWGMPSLAGQMWCQDRLKNQPFYEFARQQSLINDSNSIVILGIRKAESKRRSQYPIACWSRHKVKTAHPLLEWSETQVWEWLAKYRVSMIHPAYAIGFKRQGCFCCPNHTVEEWALLRDARPDLFMRSLEYLAIAATNDYYGSHFLAGQLIRMFGGKQGIGKPTSGQEDARF